VEASPLTNIVGYKVSNISKNVNLNKVNLTFFTYSMSKLSSFVNIKTNVRIIGSFRVMQYSTYVDRDFHKYVLLIINTVITKRILCSL
jgi:hypothetical protein